MEVTVFNSLFDKQPVHSEAKNVLKTFINKNAIVNEIRESTNKDEIDRLKKKLPIICFGGKFSKRSKSTLIESSGLIVLDFDSGNGMEMKTKFSKSPYTYAAFISPSGKEKGCKVLVKIPKVKDDEEYKEFFSFFEKNYAVDPSGKDISRACFLSYDPEIYINENAETFTKEIMNRYSKPNQEAKLIQIAANIILSAPKGEGHSACLKASYLAGGYVASANIDQSTIENALKSAAAIRRPSEIKDSFRVIEETIEIGKRNPVRDLQQIDNIVARIKKINPNSFIVGSDKIDKSASDFYENKSQKRYLTGIPELDYYLSWRPNCFSFMVGGSKAGKTTLKLYLDTFFAIKYGLKNLVLSFENDPMELQYEVIGFLTGNSAEYIYKHNRPLFNRARDFFHEHFTVLKFPPDFTFLEVIEAAKQINSQNDYHQLWIDPLFKLNGTEDYAGNKLIARHAEPFANEEMSLFISMHPKTSSQREGGHISGLDAEFGGLYSNACDINYSLSRVINDPEEDVRNTVNMSIDRVRSQRIMGGMQTSKDCPIKWKYNWKKHNYDIFVPNKDNPNSYTHHKDGLINQSDFQSVALKEYKQLTI